MKRQIKKELTSLPVIGYVISWITATAKLPLRLRELEKTNQRLTADIIRDRKRYDQVANSFLTNQETTNKLGTKLKKQEDSLVETNHKLTMLERSKSHTNAEGRKATLADNHLLDKFYVEFEDRFRGTEEDIYSRLEEYLPHLKKYKKASAKKPILDIGCGRGEFLTLMKNNGINVLGLDLNNTMAEQVRKKGLKVIEQDALSYLLEQDTNSFSAITGFHIVEHIPFDELLTLFSETYRTLAPGGSIIFETPNPENTLVGSWKFYYDPSHLHPLPPDVLAFAAESVGFSDVEIHRLHPMSEQFARKDNADDYSLDSIKHQLYGPQDYSIIATK